MNRKQLLDYIPTCFNNEATLVIAIPMAAPTDSERMEALSMLCIQHTVADIILSKRPQRFTLKDDGVAYSTVVAEFRRLKKDEQYRELFCKMACLYDDVRELKFF